MSDFEHFARDADSATAEYVLPPTNDAKPAALEPALKQQKHLKKKTNNIRRAFLTRP